MIPRALRIHLRFFGQRLPDAAFSLNGSGGVVRGGKLTLTGPDEPPEVPGAYNYEAVLSVTNDTFGVLCESRRCCGETPQEALACLEEWVNEMAKMCTEIQGKRPPKEHP